MRAEDLKAILTPCLVKAWAWSERKQGTFNFLVLVYEKSQARAFRKRVEHQALQLDLLSG